MRPDAPKRVLFLEYRRALGDISVMELVTVFSAFSPSDADLVRSRLDAAGFHPVITHGLAATSIEGYSLAAGGILVQVPEDEAKDAKEFLAPPAE
jgi:hypothetical protein